MSGEALRQGTLFHEDELPATAAIIVPRADCVEFEVLGTPRPQGSKSFRGMARRKDGTQYPRMSESSAGLDLWYNAVADAARKAFTQLGRPKIAGAVRVSMYFSFVRPKGHYGTGRNARQLKASAPRHHCQDPDLSKLVRAVEDAVTAAGVWQDDNQVEGYDELEKQWSEDHAGVWVRIREVSG